MPTATEIVRRLATNVYTTPNDKTKDAALLALICAFGDNIPETALALPPQEMLKTALAELESPEETETVSGEGNTEGGETVPGEDTTEGGQTETVPGEGNTEGGENTEGGQNG